MKVIKKITHALEHVLLSKCPWVLCPSGFSDKADRAQDLINFIYASGVIKTTLVKPPVGDILVIAPHPDDEMIGPGGTILKALDQGANTSIVCITSGSPAEKNIREQESRKVAENIGANITFLHHDQGFSCSEKLVEELGDLVRTKGNDGVFIPFIFDSHPDHRTINEVLLTAFTNNKIKGDIPVWAYQVYTSLMANTIVDITDVAEDKEKYIAFYQSQYRSRNWGHYTLGLNAYNSRFLNNRRDAAYAEVFLRAPLWQYAEFCALEFTPEKRSTS